MKAREKEGQEKICKKRSAAKPRVVRKDDTGDNKLITTTWACIIGSLVAARYDQEEMNGG